MLCCKNILNLKSLKSTQKKVFYFYSICSIINKQWLFDFFFKNAWRISNCDFKISMLIPFLLNYVL